MCTFKGKTHTLHNHGLDSALCHMSKILLLQEWGTSLPLPVDALPRLATSHAPATEMLPLAQPNVTTFIQVCALKSHCLRAGLAPSSLHSPDSGIVNRVLFHYTLTTQSLGLINQAPVFSTVRFTDALDTVVFLGKKSELFLMNKDTHESRTRPLTLAPKPCPYSVTSSP